MLLHGIELLIHANPSDEFQPSMSQGSQAEVRMICAGDLHAWMQICLPD